MPCLTNRRFVTLALQIEDLLGMARFASTQGLGWHVSAAYLCVARFITPFTTYPCQRQGRACKQVRFANHAKGKGYNSYLQICALPLRGMQDL